MHAGGVYEDADRVLARNDARPGGVRLLVQLHHKRRHLVVHRGPGRQPAHDPSLKALTDGGLPLRPLVLGGFPLLVLHNELLHGGLVVEALGGVAEVRESLRAREGSLSQDDGTQRPSSAQGLQAASEGERRAVGHPRPRAAPLRGESRPRSRRQLCHVLVALQAAGPDEDLGGHGQVEGREALLRELVGRATFAVGLAGARARRGAAGLASRSRGAAEPAVCSS